MQDEGVPLFIMVLVSAAIIGIFIIVAAILGAILLS
jgi:hypothetical protein